MAEPHDLPDPRTHMGMPLPNAKLAMWLFLVTEIMFFTALIGTYMLLRNGMPNQREPWPAPHDVHLVEWIGALNTFVLICSSLTVVLAHWSLHTHNSRRAAQYLGVTLALGCVFLGIKAYEYYSKWDHQILPGRVHEKLEGPWGYRYVRDLSKQLDHAVEDPVRAGASLTSESVAAWKGFMEAHEKEEKELKKKTEEAGKNPELKLDPAKLAAEAHEKADAELQALVAKHKDLAAIADCWRLRAKLPFEVSPRQANEMVVGTKNVKPVDLPPGAAGRAPVTGILERQPDLHLSYSIPYGNLWASCYFAMTGFHALHVFGGLVIFAIFLISAAMGRFGGPSSEVSVEVTGLYWHFVDIVWIFLFPLLYLV